MTRNVWLTGASAGIGAALVGQLAGRGYRVAVSSRKETGLQTMRDELTTEAANRVHIFPVDVTDRAGVNDTLGRIESIMGDIDLCIFNAGDYEPMRAVEFNAELFKRLVEVNYLGVINCMGAVLPNMLGRGKGEILVNASLAGYRGLPLSGPYGATKAALINMTESLRAELGQKGVSLRVINHGFVKTRLTEKNSFTMPFLITPEQAARSIIKALGRGSFEIVFPWRFAFIMKVLRCLPYRFYFPIMERVAGK